MPRRGWMIGLVFMMWLSSVSTSMAESRPLKQLPADLVRWSTVWTGVPRQMYQVGQESGPLAALFWGPTKGTAVVLEATTKELWSVMKPDQRPDQYEHEEDGPIGPIVRYEF